MRKRYFKLIAGIALLVFHLGQVIDLEGEGDRAVIGKVDGFIVEVELDIGHFFSIKYIVLELGGEGNQAGSIAQQGFKKILILDTKCLILSPLIKSWLPAVDVFLDVGYFAAVFVADGLIGLVTVLRLVGW